MIFDAKHEMIRKLVRQFAETELTTEVLDKVEETGEFPEEIDLPIETKGLKVSHFCLDCRVLLKDHAENGFVLADLYVEDAIDIYPATVGADYTIRDYRITVSEAKVRSEMELIVLGIAEGLTFVD